MPPQPLLAAAITYIFAKMRLIHNSKVGSNVGAWQRQFLRELLRVLFAMRGRINFTNMARYSAFCEQTFRRQFRKAFDWVAFNLVIFRLRRHPVEPLIGAFDCTFLPKSGKKTWGLGRFFSSAAGKNKRGLEVSILGEITTKSREPVGLDATQIPSISAGKKVGYSRVDFYCEQLLDLVPRLEKADLGIDHWVGDGYYAKQKVLEAIDEVGADLITRLRSDANLRYQLEFVIRDAFWHIRPHPLPGPKRGEDRLPPEHEHRGGGIAPAFGQNEGMFATDLPPGGL